MPDQPRPKQPDRVKFWTDILDRFGPTGLTHVAYCRRERVPISSFYAWRRRLRPTMGGAANAPQSPTPKPPARLPAAKTSVVNAPKHDAGASFVELALCEPAARAPGSANAATLRLDALDLILRGIRQLIQECP